MTSERVREALGRYNAHFPQHRHAMAQDPTYRAQMKWLLRVLELADMAMEDEGVPERSRYRVICTALYGSPDPDVALDRVEAGRLLAEQLARGPVTWEGPVPPYPWNGPGGPPPPGSPLRPPPQAGGK